MLGDTVFDRMPYTGQRHKLSAGMSLLVVCDVHGHAVVSHSLGLAERGECFPFCLMLGYCLE